MRRRSLAWILGISTAVAAAGFEAAIEVAGRGDDQAGAVSESAGPRAGEGTAVSASLLPLERLQRGSTPQPAVELFGARSWRVEPPPPPPSAPPVPVAVKPTAPPLPFVFMGRMMQDERHMVFLVQGDRIHVVAEGDVIDDAYRLEKIEPGRMTLRYLPLGMAQTLLLEDPT